MRRCPRSADGRPAARRRSKATNELFPSSRPSGAFSTDRASGASLGFAPSAAELGTLSTSTPRRPQRRDGKSPLGRRARPGVIGGVSEVSLPAGAKPLESPAAKVLRTSINRRLDRYLHRRAQKHERDLSQGHHLNEHGEQMSNLDARSQSVVSGQATLKTLLAERANLRRDGLLEKALELDAPIAALQDAQKRERAARCKRQLVAAKQRVAVQHAARERALEEHHAQERMARDRDARTALELLKREHDRQASSYVEEMVDKAEGYEKPAADALPSDRPAYLAANQKFNIRTRTKTPEFVRQLKLAKHLRKKKRFAEADEHERHARKLDLETAKSHCDAVKRVATGRRLENLVVQHQNAYAALERRHASRLLSMERRQEKALANLKSLLHVELAKLDKQYRTALSANYATFDEAQAVARVDFAAPRPPSAPPRLRRRASSVTRNDGKTFGSPRTLHGSMWTAGPV